jgi:hypothetical protein
VPNKKWIIAPGDIVEIAEKLGLYYLIDSDSKTAISIFLNNLETYFIPLAEWRDKQIDSILEDD